MNQTIEQKFDNYLNNVYADLSVGGRSPSEVLKVTDPTFYREALDAWVIDMFYGE
jgi:hypothetical protein